VGVIVNHSGGSSLEFVLYFDGVPPNLADVAVGVSICEIFGVVRFSTFSKVSVKSDMAALKSDFRYTPDSVAKVESCIGPNFW